MRVNDRPGLEPVWLLSCGFVTITLVLVLFLTRWVPKDGVVVCIGVAVVLGAVAVMIARPLMRPFDPALRGVGAILLIWFTSAAVLLCVATGSRTWIWLHFLLLLAIVTVTAYVLSAEWSERSFLATSALLALLIGAYIVRVGYGEQRASLVERPINEAVRDKAVLAARAERDQQESERSLAAAKKKVEDELLQAVSVAPPGFREAGRAVLDQLVGMQRNLPAARVEVARIYSLGVPQPNQIEAHAVRDKAKAAVDQHAVAGQVPPKATAFDEALTDACARAQASNLHPKECPTPISRISGEAQPAPPATEAALRRLAVELAYYRAAVTKADADKVAAEAAAKASPRELEVSMWESFLAGPEAIVESVDPNNPLRLIPGPVGWFLLGATLLGLLRVLRKRNAGQAAGPVQVDYTGEYKAELRIALLSNLPRPASAPGATVLQSITDLSSFAGPGGKTLEGLLNVVKGALTRGHGYIVDADLAQPPKSAASGDGKQAPPSKTAEPKAAEPKAAEPKAAEAKAAERKAPTRVLVSVSSASTKELVANQQFENEIPEKAMRAAGLSAAGLILSRSTRIPSWAGWKRETAEALATASTDDPKLPDLEEAVRAAPTSGIVLQLYGGVLELEGRAYEAIAAYARAVALHPRYLPARYRLAVSLGMAGRNISKWKVASISDRGAMVHAIRQATARLGINDVRVEALDRPEPEEAFKELAVELLRTVEVDASCWRAISGSLRRTDRDDIWRPSAKSRFPWRRWEMDRLRAKSARLAYTSQQDRNFERLLIEIKEAADDPRISWQLSYNLACYYAQARQDEALRRLEDCLVRPDVNELTARWVAKDPDLTPISGHPRFKRFCTQLQGKA